MAVTERATTDIHRQLSLGSRTGITISSCDAWWDRRVWRRGGTPRADKRVRQGLYAQRRVWRVQAESRASVNSCAAGLG